MRARVLLFGVVTGIMTAGYGVMFTVLDDFRTEYGIQAQWLGLIVGIGFLMSFTAQVFLSPLADRGHARRLVLIGIMMNVIGAVTMGLGTSLPIILTGRVVQGLGIGMTFPAIRRIVITLDPDHLGPNLGLLFSADIAGFASGPALSAILVPRLGIPAPFLVIAALSLMSIPLVVHLDIAETPASTAAPSRFAFDLLRNRSMVAAMMMGSAIFLMIGTFDALWAVVLDDLGASELVANAGITVFSLPLIVLGPYGGRLAQRLGPFRVGPVGIAIAGIVMSLYGVMPTGEAMLAVGITQAVLDGLTASSTAVGVGLVVPSERQAGAQGLTGAAQTLTAATASVAAGWMYSAGGRQLAYWSCAVVMVMLATGAYVMARADGASRLRGVSSEAIAH